MKTTIQISPETKKMISTFGTKGESFETIIKRIYNMATKEQLREFLMSSEKCVPVKDALERAKKKWQE